MEDSAQITLVRLVILFSSLPDAAPVHCALEDVDDDGDIDMILHYKTQDTGLLPGDEADCLTGNFIDGCAFEGCDSVRTVPAH